MVAKSLNPNVIEVFSKSDQLADHEDLAEEPTTEINSENVVG